MHIHTYIHILRQKHCDRVHESSIDGRENRTLSPVDEGDNPPSAPTLLLMMVVK